MAKKKTEEVPVEMDFVERAISGIEDLIKTPGLLTSGDFVADEKKIVVPICPSLDIATWGGIEEGSWTVIAGPEKIGKTVCALQIAANAQKPEYGGRPVFYGAVEGRIDRKTLKGIRGLDLSHSKFQVIRSKKGKRLTGQDFLRIFQHIIENVPGAVLIIDSISCLLDEKVANEGIGTETRSSGYKFVSQFIDLTCGSVPANRTIVLGIARQIANTGGGLGAKKVDKLSTSWKYQWQNYLKALYKKPLVAQGRQIGQIVHWYCGGSCLGAPGRKIESYLRYGVGFDAQYENFVFGQTAQLLKKGGAWVSFDFLGTEAYQHLLTDGEIPKAQGQEAAFQLLCEHPEWMEALSNEVKKFADVLAGTSAEEE